MSTKALRRAIELLKGGRSSEEWQAGRDAEAELKAIEKAAKTIDGCFFIGEPYRHSETCRDAATLMRSIASEAAQ